MIDEKIAILFSITNAWRSFISNDGFTSEQKGQIAEYLCNPDKYPQPNFEHADYVLIAILTDCDAIIDSRRKQRERTAKRREKMSRDVTLLAPAHAYNETKHNETKHNETKCVCVTHTAPDGADAHTHTRFEFRFEDVDFAGLAALKIPKLYAMHRYKELAATGFTLADGKHIDLAGFNAHVLAFWKHEKDKAPYSEALKTEIQTAKLAGRVWERKYWDICAERGCIHADTHQRGWGCKLCAIPPPQRPRPVPPEECDKFEKGL